MRQADHKGAGNSEQQVHGSEQSRGSHTPPAIVCPVYVSIWAWGDAVKIRHMDLSYRDSWVRVTSLSGASVCMPAQGVSLRIAPPLYHNTRTQKA